MVTKENFNLLFPFYIAFDQSDRLSDLGDSMKKIVGEVISSNFFTTRYYNNISTVS